MFRPVVAEGRIPKRQRNEIEDRAVSLLSELPDYRLLATIPDRPNLSTPSVLGENQQAPCLVAQVYQLRPQSGGFSGVP